MTRYTGLVVLLVFFVCLYAQAESLRRKTTTVTCLTGMASWYPAAADAAGDLTCAMRSVDFGNRYRVCNTENNKCVVVRHTGWGPNWVSFRQGRVIDLNKEAFSRISDLSRGVIRVTVTQEKVPVGSNDRTSSR